MPPHTEYFYADMAAGLGECGFLKRPLSEAPAAVSRFILGRLGTQQAGQREAVYSLRELIEMATNDSARKPPTRRGRKDPLLILEVWFMTRISSRGCMREAAEERPGLYPHLTFTPNASPVHLRLQSDACHPHLKFTLLILLSHSTNSECS